MKLALKIVKSRWLPKSNTKMIHTDENGRLYLGGVIEVMDEEILIAEVSNSPSKDGYYDIVKVIDKIKDK